MEKLTAKNELWEIALGQHGYVTAKQAKDLGITQGAVTMLVQRGTLERAGYGIYRFSQIPVSQYDQYALAVLWTGIEGTVLSHETALDAYEICDINPFIIHLTVGKKYRVRRAGGDIYRVHYEDINDLDIGWWQEIPIVKPAKAIAQCLDYGTPTYLLVQAIERGYSKGHLRKSEHDVLLTMLEDIRG